MEQSTIWLLVAGGCHIYQRNRGLASTTTTTTTAAATTATAFTQSDDQRPLVAQLALDQLVLVVAQLERLENSDANERTSRSKRHIQHKHKQVSRVQRQLLFLMVHKYVQTKVSIYSTTVFEKKNLIH